MSSSLSVLTTVHVAISLIAIAAGFVVVRGLLSSQPFDRATKVFLAFTALTSITGFFFPIHGFTPAIGVGIVSLLVLPIAVYARYRRHLAGRWRWIYVVTAMISLYLNVFVLVVQVFRRVPALHALAPTESEPPFAIAQGIVMLLFIALTVLAAMRFHVGPRSVELQPQPRS